MEATHANTPRSEREKIVESVDNSSDEKRRTISMRPQMTLREIELFKCAVQGKKTVIEFGSGGSTFLLVSLGAERILSVESDPAWIRQVAEHEDMAPHIASGRLIVYHGDIGSIGKWGYPIDKSLMHTWPNYWRLPWSRIEPKQVELVFVDGRFRVACALNALLQGSLDMTIMVHDFWKRPQYEVLLKYLNCACRVDNLAVFFSKSDINLTRLKNDLDRYSFSSI